MHTSTICAALAEYIVSNGQSSRLETQLPDHPELLLSAHLTFSTDRTPFDVDAPSINLPIPDLDDLRALSPHLAPLFQGPRLSVLSAEMLLAERCGYSHALFELDYSMSFDSNVAERLRAYVFGSGRGSDDTNRVIEFIRLAKQRRWRLDVLPCLIENLRHTRQEGNARPLETLLAFRMLDHLDRDACLENARTLTFSAIPSSLREQAARDLDEITRWAGAERHERRQLGTYALLLRLAELWLSDQKQPQRTFRRLLDFSVFEIGRFAALELALAWDFLCQPSIRFFGPLCGVAKDLIARLRGMAWDIEHYRLLEWLSARCAGRTIFVPIFVALDSSLVELIRAKSIVVQVVDRSTQTAESVRVGEYEFRLAVDAHISPEARAALADSERRIAHARGALDRAPLARLVAALEPRVDQLAREEWLRREQPGDGREQRGPGTGSR